MYDIRKNLVKNEKCVQNFTVDLILPYLLCGFLCF